jgi:Rrf2 family protein
MKLSSKVRYALLALLELANSYEQGNFLQIDQIAATHHMPERYLAQLLMALRRCGLVRSQRGAKGGYALAQEPGKITVYEVLICLDGIKTPEPIDPMTDATPATAAIEEVCQEATTAAIVVLQRHTLQDLCQKRDDSQLNSMYYI